MAAGTIPLPLASEAALVTLSLTIPATQGLWLSAQASRTYTDDRSPASRRVSLWTLFLLPFSGGPKHIAFQVAAWTCWIQLCAGTVLISAATTKTDFLALDTLVPKSHHQFLLGASLVCGILGEALLLKSFLVFTGSRGSRLLSGWPAYVAAAAVVGSGALLSLLGFSLMTYLDSLPDLPSRLVYCALAAVCLIISTSCTHGLAGDLLHGDEEGAGWRFFQPGVGGTIFVAIQACGWIFFALAILGVGAIARAMIQGVVHRISVELHVGTGIVMIMGQVMLGGSLMAFRSRSKSVRGEAEKHGSRQRCSFSGHCISSMLFLPAHIFGGVVFLLFSAVSFQVAAAVFSSILIPYYGLTSWGAPAHTGRREWGAFKLWWGTHIVDAMSCWLGGLEVLRSSKSVLPPDEKYVFGYHPHGLLPAGAAYMASAPAFKQTLPGIEPVTLVSRDTFVLALETRRSVLLCPGGQAELVDAYRIHGEHKEMVINVRHRGFIRLALQQGAKLVPVLVFGELHSFRNLFNWPQVQQWAYRRFGFPIPYLMVGKYYTPLPNKHPVAFVIGDPISPRSKGAASEEDVELVHSEYYGELRRIFEEHKGRFPEYKDAKLVFSMER